MLSFTPITISIIAITCIISFAGFSNPKIINELIFWPPAITNHRQYYRFVTCGFVHANLMHLGFNMFTLYFFGRIMEVYYMGRLGLQHYYFFILYIGALVISVLPTYLKQKNNYNYRSLGASGAVCAVLFAFVLLEPWQVIYVLVIPVPAIIYAVLFLVYSMYMSKKGGDYINHDAHFYGALFGVTFTVVLRPQLVGYFFEQLRHPHFNI
jgi:membrane associated rhomboid family serine protease